MRKFDYLLVSISILFLLLMFGSSWIIMLKIFLGILLISFVLYWKILPYQIQLARKYQKVFNIIKGISQRFLNVLDFLPKLKLGQGLQLDMSYVTIIIIFVITLIIL